MYVPTQTHIGCKDIDLKISDWFIGVHVCTESMSAIRCRVDGRAVYAGDTVNVSPTATTTNSKTKSSTQTTASYSTHSIPNDVLTEVAVTTNCTRV